MKYPELPDTREALELISYFAQLKHEYGATKEVQSVLAGIEKDLRKALDRLKVLPGDKALAAKEPSDLAGIRKLRPNGPRRMWKELDLALYQDRLEGAFLARLAGCILGAPVEGQPIEQMEKLAKEIGDPFPPKDFWKRLPNPENLRYWRNKIKEFSRTHMDGVPVDDDIVYTILGLLIVEDYGLDFTTADVGKAWVKRLPFGCTAEGVALNNLKGGVPVSKAGEKDNPFSEWIGADIRSDPWAYMAPGWPELAADMAWRDAFLSHRRNGVFGEMYFSAAISAAFAVDDPTEALRIGLTEIPKECAMAKAVRWALKEASGIKNYRDARAAVDDRFAGMHGVHTINNACLTIWGLTIGGTDVTRVLGETVAMGLDNDCTAATAGSIVGAVVGKKGVPKHWHKNFNDSVCSYLNKQPTFKISDLLRRFAKQAKLAYKK